MVLGTNNILLDTSKIEKHLSNYYNPKAYEYYLRAKHLYFNSSSIEDLKKLEDLIQTSIQIDNNILEAKNLLANFK